MNASQYGAYQPLPSYGQPLPSGGEGDLFPHHIPLSVKMLAAYLFMITLFGKGPTYIGVHPIYWGEVVLMMLSGWTLQQVSQFGLPPQFRRFSTLPVLGFVMYGFFRTLPDIPTYGMSTLRDAAVWYYALFYFLGLYLPRIPRYADYVVNLVNKAWVLVFFWLLFNRSTNGRYLSYAPVFHGTTVLWGTVSEQTQHLFMSVMLILIGIRKSAYSLLSYILSVIVVFTSFYMIFTIAGRGVKVAIIVSLFVSFIATFGAKRPIWTMSRWILLIYFSLFLLGSYTIYLGPEEVMNTLYSRTGSERFEEAIELKGTANWRMRWWKAIYAEVNEKVPIVGLGFGMNLHDLSPDPFENQSQYRVRSPHCYSMTIFARMGYLGAFIWAMVVITGIVPLFMRIRKSGVVSRFGEFFPYKRQRHQELLLYLVFIIATVVNASFGVLMEGPVLGIWFWFALGFATARSESPDAFEPISAASPDPGVPWMGNLPIRRSVPPIPPRIPVARGQRSCKSQFVSTTSPQGYAVSPQQPQSLRPPPPDNEGVSLPRL